MIWKLRGRKNDAREVFGFSGDLFVCLIVSFFLLVAKNPPYCCSVVVGSEGMEWKETAFGKQK